MSKLGFSPGYGTIAEKGIGYRGAGAIGICSNFHKNLNEVARAQPCFGSRYASAPVPHHSPAEQEIWGRVPSDFEALAHFTSPRPGAPLGPRCGLDTEPPLFETVVRRQPARPCPTPVPRWESSHWPRWSV